MTETDVLSVLDNIAQTTFTIPEDEFDDSVNLLELGIDSLMLLRFGQEIERKFKIKLEMAWFFQHQPSLQTLASHVAGLCESLPAPSSPPHPDSNNGTEIPDDETTGEGKNTVDINFEGDDELFALFRSQAAALESLFDKQLAALDIAHGTAAIDKAEKKQPDSGIQHNVRSFKLDAENNLSTEQEAFIDELLERHIARTKQSREQTQKNRRELADWKNTLSYRQRLKEAIYPIIADGSDGARFTDLDGNEYIDIALGMGVNFMGHRHPLVVEAVEKRLADGFELGPQCNITGETAERIARLTGMERVCFCNTGSEAVMIALRLARASSGRRKVAMFNGAYHGVFDGVLGISDGDEISALSPGTPPGMIEDIVLLDYDSESSLQRIEELAGELAAVLVEPVQSRRPSLQPQTFLRRLRRITRKHDIALIFDEMVNGFRIAPGGAQEYFGIRADMALYGKTIGGGLPIGLITGSSRYLDFIDGGYWQYGDDSMPDEGAIVFGGTFCRHPFAMESVKAVAEHFIEEGPALQDRVSSLAAFLADELNIFFQDEEVPLRIERFGSQFRFDSFGKWSLLANPIELDLFFILLCDEGVYVWERRTCCLSVAHTKADIEAIIAAAKKAIATLRKGGFPFRYQRGVPDSFHQVSSVQKRIFAAMQVENGQAPYHMPAAWKVKGEPDIEWLEICFGEIIKRHESLRSGFRLIDGRLMKTIVQEPRFSIERIDADNCEPEKIQQDFIRPFDLEQPPLIRIGVAQLAADEWLFLFDSLHIVVDGISLATITQELNAYYNRTEPPPMQSSYSQYETFMREFETSDACNEQREFWRKTLEDAPAPLSFSRTVTDTQGSAPAGHVRGELDAPVFRKAAASLAVTPYMLLLAVYGILVRSLTGSMDMLIGVATGGRPEERFSSMVGMFVNTLPLRIRIDESKTVRDFLSDVRAVCAESYQNQDAPFELTARDTGAIVSTMLTFESADERSLALDGLEIEELDAPIPGSMFEFSLDAIEKNNVIHLDFEFDSNALDEADLGYWAESFEHIAHTVCENPSTVIGEISLLQPKTITALNAQWDNGPSIPETEKTVVSLIAETAEKHPEAAAIISPAKTISYAELESRSTAIAARLINDYAIGAESLVAFAAAPSAVCIETILAVLKAGAAFLPLDHEAPSARIQDLIDDADISLLIGDGTLFESLETGQKCNLMQFADIDVDGKQQELKTPSPENLAYVIYTSGSTGRPKGCEIEHASLMNYVLWAKEYYFAEQDCGNFCLTSKLAFDMTMMSLFLPLCMGRTLRIPNQDSNPAEALALALSPGTETDVLNITPSHARIIAGLGIKETNITGTVIGGEALRTVDVETLFSINPEMAIFNEYGPTEATIGCTSTRVTPGETIDIGLPVTGATVYILNDSAKPLPPGAWGELCIGGACLARGYRNNIELTRDRFMTLPDNGERVYRSGDSAKRSANGRITLGGRLDDQFKIAGHRIEAGDIEHTIMLIEEVSEAAVVYGDHLAAFIVGNCPAEDIRRFLMDRLPDYMLPRQIELVDSLPVSSSGKIDRKALQALIHKDIADSSPAETSQSTPALVIMRELSGNPLLGLADNFFAAGGSSLDAVTVVARCRKDLGIDVDLRGFFAAPTAETIQNCTAKVPDTDTLIHSPVMNRFPQTPGQKQIWLAARQGGSAYNMTEMFLFEGVLDNKRLKDSFSTLVAKHEILRTTFDEQDGEFFQTVHDNAATGFYFEYEDLSGSNDFSDLAKEKADSESLYRFDLASGPLIRIVLLKTAPETHFCILNIHHIISDGWTTTILLDEVSRLYRENDSSPTPSEWHYRDYAAWFAGYLDGSRAESDLEFWRKTLVPPIPELSLPTRKDASEGDTHEAGIVNCTLDPSLAESLNKLAKKNGATLFMTLLTGLGALLHQRSSAEDIVIGTPVSGRVLTEFETMPGYFLNTLPLRIALEGDMRFSELLTSTTERVSSAFAHQVYPFDMLVDRFAGPDNSGRNPLFDVMLILQNTAEYRLDIPGVTATRSYAPRSPKAKFEIMFELESTTNGIEGIVEFDRSRYDEAAIESLVRDYTVTLKQLVENPDTQVSSLFSLLSGENAEKTDQFLNSLDNISEEF